VHLCGTFTGALYGTLLFFQGSGTSVNPITLLFETGATLTSPVWSNGNNAASGAINTNGQSYLVINGGPTCGWNQATLTTTPCNGSIQDTANGTTLAYQTYTTAIDIVYSSSYVTVENLGCYNMYQRRGNATEDPSWNQQHCVMLEGTPGNSPSHITITNNVFHDGGWLVSDNSYDDYLTIGPGNDFYNADHDVNGAPPHFYVFGNHMHDWAIWDSTADAYHHDGIHCFAGAGGNTQAVYIYDNQFDGATGNNMNQFIFLEGAGSSTTCMVPGGTEYIFNNIMVMDGESPSLAGIYGNSTTGDVNDVFTNNTMLNNQPSNSQNCEETADSLQATVENNAIGGCGELVAAGGTFSLNNFKVFDYNAYENCSGYNCWSVAGVDSSSFAVWQAGSCTGSANTCDRHGKANVSSSTYFALGSGCVPGSVGANCAPVSGSPLIGAGANLYSICNGQPNPGLGALCLDIVGNPRSSSPSQAWDVGAYVSGTSTSANQPAPPTGLTATVN
jgi:hypothetical protein